MMKEVSSVVSFVDQFVRNRCFQFGFITPSGTTRRVVVGHDVFRLGLTNWQRPINSAPGEDVWLALFLAPLIKEGLSSYKVVVSHPNALKEQFQNLPEGKIKIILPTYDDAVEVQRAITIEEAWPVPEAYAHATAYFDTLKRDCVVISVGFGTLEIGMVDSSAEVFEHRMRSLKVGLHLVAQPFREKLLGLKFDPGQIRSQNQDFYFDSILQRVVDENLGLPTESPLNLIIPGESLTAADLKEVSDEVLTNYAKSLVTHICDYVETQNFTGAPEFVITGGGVNYPIIVNTIKDALKKYGITSVTVATKKAAKYSAAIGLDRIASRIFRNADNAIGIDVGNNSILFEGSDPVSSTNEIDIEIPRAEYTMQ